MSREPPAQLPERPPRSRALEVDPVYPAQLPEGRPAPGVLEEVHPVDLVLAKLASRQRGAVTAVQLRALGVSRNAVAHRVKTGRLHRVHRGVYLVGHWIAAPLAHEQAALLACGDDSFISHRT